MPPVTIATWVDVAPARWPSAGPMTAAAAKLVSEAKDRTVVRLAALACRCSSAW